MFKGDINYVELYLLVLMMFDFSIKKKMNIRILLLFAQVLKKLYRCQKIRVSMKLLEFTKCFPDEESCIRHLKEQREKAGVVCSHCGGTHQRWDKYNKCWVCSKCGHHTTLR
jgi:hypothetical protein